MAKIKDDQPLLPSVLDRLLDEDPEVKREPAKSRHQVLRELKLAVCRDLENLLNTRRRCLPWPIDLTELERSLVNYGVPDFTGANMGSAEQRAELRGHIEALLGAWEPRFQKVQVTLVDTEELLSRTLLFRIEALLRADPAPEPVVFDSDLEPVTGLFHVKGVS